MAKKSALSLVPAITTISPPAPIHPNCPPSPAEIVAAKNFERALGGRLRLIEELASSPKLTADIETILVVRNAGGAVAMQEGRDVWWHEALADAAVVAGATPHP